MAYKNHKIHMKTIRNLSLCCGILAILSSCNTSETTSARQIAIVDAVFASGHIIMENEYLVTANSEGYLVAAPIQEGDSVNAGMPLFQLSSEVQNELRPKWGSNPRPQG